MPGEEKPRETGVADGPLLGSELGNDWAHIGAVGPQSQNEGRRLADGENGNDLGFGEKC